MTTIKRKHTPPASRNSLGEVVQAATDADSIESGAAVISDDVKHGSTIGTKI